MRIPQIPYHAPRCCKLISNKKLSLWNQNQLSGYGRFCVHTPCLRRGGARDLGGGGIPLWPVGLTAPELGQHGAYSSLLLNVTAREMPNLAGHVPGGEGRLVRHARGWKIRRQI